MLNIESNRIQIREFQSTDLEDFYEIFGDAETMFYCEPAYSRKQAKQFLETFCLSQPRPAFAVVLKSAQKVVGYLLFNSLYGNPKKYEMGWWINRKYWRQGLAYEACKMLIDYGFDTRGIDCVLAETIDKNASTALMKKLGMKKIETEKNKAADNSGQLHDLIWFEVKKHDRV